VSFLGYRTRLAIIIAATIVPIAILFQLSPISQNLSYHDFADKRTFLSISSFWNVFSNLPFLLFGVLGLVKLIDLKNSQDLKGFLAYWFVFFFSIALVSFGSAYYHWIPNNSSLVWDRLPMTLAFMSFFSFIVAERIHKTAGLILLPILLTLGIVSVWYWNFTEAAGAGDLRPYVLVQFLPLLEIPLVCFLFPVNDRETKFLFYAFGWYALAKILEYFDRGIFALTASQMGGHALKHLAAGMAVYALYKYVFSMKRV
jgi:hypothetical protein